MPSLRYLLINRFSQCVGKTSELQWYVLSEIVKIENKIYTKVEKSVRV